MVIHTIFRCKFITYFLYYLIIGGKKQGANLLLQQIICYFAVVMKCPFYISLLLCCLLGLAACTGPVILDEEKTPETETEQDNTVPERDPVPIVHEGTYNSPYSIAEAQTLGHGKGVWIEGYIVGSVTGSMKSGCNFTVQATTLSNILLADTFPLGGENDYLKCLPIELPNNSAEREDLNLYDNPDNYHRKVRIEGDITLYYKVVGIKEISDYSFGGDEDEDEDENENDNKDEDSEEPDTPYNPDETRQDTLNIAEGIKMQKEDGYEQARIKGYIVGYAKGNKSIVYIDSETVTTSKARENVVLADNIDERDNTKVIIVKLPKGFIRDEVNLYDNPQNLHKQLTVTGMMTPYYGLAGCTETLGAENRERFLLE